MLCLVFQLLQHLNVVLILIVATQKSVNLEPAFQHVN